MSSATFYPAVDSDNGFWSDTGEIFSGGWSNTSLGLGKNGSYYNNIWLRFPNVTIPKDASISSAIVSIVCSHSRSGETCTIAVRAEDGVSPSAPTSVADANSRTLTTASVAGITVPVLAEYESFSTPNISSVVTEITSLSGWSSGSAILLFLKDDGSTPNALRDIAALGLSSGAYKASLAVTWGTSSSNDGDCDIPSMSMDVFPLAMSGAVADMSIPALQSLQLGGEALLPVMEMAATGYEYVAGAGANGSMSLRIDNDGLGGLSCSATSAPVGATTIPAATMSATAKPGNDGVMTMSLALMTGMTGSRGEADLSAPTMTAWTINSSSGSITITPPVVSASGKNGIVGSVAASIPKLKVSGTALVGMVASGLVQLRMVVDGRGTNGQIASGRISMRIRPMTATGAASVVSKGAGVINILPADCSASAVYDSSEFSSPLAYNREAIR